MKINLDIMRKCFSILTAFLVIGVMIYWNDEGLDDKSKMPVPIEFLEKKKKKKEFKKHRKTFFEHMHQTDSNTDWRELDRQTRKEKTEKSKVLLESMLNEGRLNRDNLSKITVPHRNLQGEWAERGSNNLAGRIRTADIDFNNNLIYCVSSGGNIWRGTLDGEDWVSLTDYQQVLGVTFLRKIGDRILFANNKGFYYSDNEGLILNEAEGLDITLNWESIKRTIIKAETNEIYCLVKESFNGAVTSIYKSEDLGESFSRILSFNSNSGIDQEDVSHIDIWTSRYFETYLYVLND